MRLRTKTRHRSGVELETGTHGKNKQMSKWGTGPVLNNEQTGGHVEQTGSDTRNKQKRKKTKDRGVGKDRTSQFFVLKP